MKISDLFRNDKDTAYLLLGHVSFLLLFLASTYFYKERILFADTAYQFFKIINYEKLFVEANRYGAILPAFPLLLAIKLGMSLKLLTIVYSVSFIGLYYLVFLVCAYLLRNMAAALAVVFTLILCISQSFFHPVTETHQSLVYSVLLFAVLQHPTFRFPLLQFLVATLVITLAFLAHPVAVYPMVFIIGYVALDKRQLRSVLPYALLFVAAGLALAKVLLTQEDSYEGRFFSELLSAPSNMLSLPQAYSLRFFITRIPHLYLWVIVMEFVLIIYLYFRKEYLKLAWQVGVLGIFMLITILTYNKGDSDLMMERAFMPLALFVSIPFLKDFIGTLPKYKTLKLVGLALIMVFSFNRIYVQGRAFKGRTGFNQDMLMKTAYFPNRKFIVESEKLKERNLTY